jgi:ATP-binding cassette, subfamily B, bacterial
MMLVHDAPDPVLAALKRESRLDSDPVLLTTCSDLGLEGKRAIEWLIATERWIGVADESPRLLREVSVADAASFRARAAVGCGFLQAKIDGGWIDLCRYSNALAPRFARVARKLEALKKHGTITIDPEERAGERCTACSAKLRYRGELCLACIDRRAVVRRVWDLLHAQRWPTLVLFATVLLGIGVSLVPPKLQEYLVDDVLRAGTNSAAEGFFSSLGAIVLALGFARVIGAALGEIKGIVSHRIGTQTTFHLRKRMVKRLHELPIAFYDKNQVGALATRVATDSEAMYGLIHQLTHGFLLQVLQFAGVGTMLFVINPKLALYTLLPAPLVIFGSWVYWTFVHPKYFRATEASSKQMTALLGMLSGVRVVKAFAQEEREIERFASVGGHFRDVRLEVGHSATTYGISMSLLFSLGGLIVWYAGGRDVIEAHMSLGELMAFLAYLAMFYGPLSTLAQLTTWISSFVASSARVLELLDTPSEMIDPSDPKELVNYGAISFENVTFGYDRHQPVLENLSFEIPRGQMVGIVGKSGSGKTTMVHLICRFYDVQQGRVAIDGIDVRDVSLADLRKRIGVVLQETFLFRGTIWENVAYGRSDATVEQGIAAAKAARAHDFIMKMPFAYDHVIGERGVNLSGGERQRIAIARALLYEPSILILDEATSNLDSEAEQAIQDALKELARGRTVLAIAHRLSTLRHASRILLFENGKLIEDGSHAGLVEKNGTYAELLRMQSRLVQGAPIEALNGSRERSADFAPRWLTPDRARIFRCARAELCVEVDGRTCVGVAAALAFPTRPGTYVCLSDETEIGIIRDISEWSTESRALIEEAVSRRYHLNAVETIDRIELSVGLLTLDVGTESGRKRFVMRSNQASVHDYGRNGKILTDVDDNLWLIRNLDDLPKGQRSMFQRFVYW